MSTFADHGIEIPPNAAGPKISTTCPECSDQRRKRGAKCLSVNTEKQVWLCHHCGWSGGLRGDQGPKDNPRREKRYRKPDPRPRLALPQNALDWFHGRGITDAVLARNRVDYGRAYFPQIEDNAEAIIFPYFRGGEEINRKYRNLAEKHFRLESGCELILYGLDDIDAARPLVWVEGEIDKLSLEGAGFRHVVSVPNGAPPATAKNYSASLSFLDADAKHLEAVQRHIIAVDSDAPGNRLEEELARRLGPEKCLRVAWPEGCKDANDVLLKHGADDLRWFVDNAQPFPIQGVVGVDDLRSDVTRLYEHGQGQLYSTGYPGLDRIIQLRPGLVIIITGIPGSGKSNLLDNTAVNLGRQYSWRFAVFSPENLPTEEHLASIAEKYTGRPFHDGPTPRMTRTELGFALDWVREHFLWIMPDNEDDWTVEKILEIAGHLCLRHGINGLVIDPWNELESLRPDGMTQTEYIGRSLKRIRVFARKRKIVVWIVVHPTKMHRLDNGQYPVPSLYDCADSAHWRNKSDVGLSVWRDLKSNTREVEIHVQKVRQRHVGSIGMCKLYYDPVTATYDDQEHPWQQQREWV